MSSHPRKEDSGERRSHKRQSREREVTSKSDRKDRSESRDTKRSRRSSASSPKERHQHKSHGDRHKNSHHQSSRQGSRYQGSRCPRSNHHRSNHGHRSHGSRSRSRKRKKSADCTNGSSSSSSKSSSSGNSSKSSSKSSSGNCSKSSSYSGSSKHSSNRHRSKGTRDRGSRHSRDRRSVSARSRRHRDSEGSYSTESDSDSTDEDGTSSSSSESEIDETDPKRAVAWEWDQGFPDEVWYAAVPDAEAVRKFQVCSVTDTKCIPLLTEKNLDTVDGCISIVKNCFQGVRIGSYNGERGEQGGFVRRWRFKDILGLGHGSTVLAGSLKMQSAEGEVESQQMAFKLVLKATKASRIAGVEAPLLRKLDGKGFPKLFFRLSRRMRENKKFRVVVLGVERQGTSLDESAGDLDLEEALLVGVHLVQALRRLHELGWAHLSIKPENICWGLRSDGEDDLRSCVLLDLERAERLGEEISGTVKGMAPFCGRTGVFQALRLYSSGVVLPTHDLESVYYIMMSLILSPKLHQWADYVNNSSARNDQVARMKRDELASGLFPYATKRFGKAATEPLKEYLEYVRGCDPKNPDYDHLLAILSRSSSLDARKRSKSKA